MIRLFTAIAIPPEIGQGLLSRQHGIEGARWRPLEAFHITLKFIGDVQEPVAAELDEALAQIAAPAFDLELTRAVSDAVPVPVIASGGVGTLQHLADGVTTGRASAVLAASIFHFGQHTVGECKRFMAEQGIEVRI